MGEHQAEIKFTFAGADVAAAISSYELDRAAADRRTIHFLDERVGTGLRLFDAGVVLRLRGHGDDTGDTTLKLRPAPAGRLTGRWLPGTEHTDEYRVEFDWARKPVLAASVVADIEPDDLAEVVASARKPKQAFTGEQQDFLQRCGPGLGHPFRGLHLAGPITALRWSALTWPGSADLRAEQWTYSGDRTFLELSLKVPFTEAPAYRDLLNTDIEHRGLHLDEATTKTETVLRDLL
jgi:hypothetical protein